MKRGIYRPSWKFRPPPENTEVFQMCGNPQCCIFGNACASAHSAEELQEWKIRSVSRIHHQQRAVMEKKQSIPLTNTQHLRDNINEGRRLGVPSHVMITEVTGKQMILCKQNLFVTHLDKNKEITWEFNINVQPTLNGTIHGLQNVFLLEDNSPEFSFAGLSLHRNERCRPFGRNMKEICLKNFSLVPPNYASVLVRFSATSYGNFDVSVIFDFGYSPRIVRYLGVVVAPEKHLIKTLAFKPTVDSEKNNELIWLAKHKLVPFDCNSDEKQDSNKSSYAIPSNLKYGVDYGAFEHLDVELTRDNYRDRLHTLLYLEEYERRERMSRLNVHCEDIFTLFRKGPRPRSLRNLDLKKTLFISVAEEILEEVGILLSRGSKALLRIRQFVYGAPGSQDFVLHEALVVNILSNEIIIEISWTTLSLLNSMAAPVPVDICFRFVNTFLSMHSAIDRVNLDLIFNSSDTTEVLRSVPTLPHSVLSPAQASAISLLLKSPPGAPILLLGPFGTGKTQTLAEAVKVLIARKNAKPSDECRILICTHSNSAADHYIENYLHPVYEELRLKDPSVEKPLRVYWEHRLAMTISEKMMPYCIMDMNNGTFRNPTLEELKRKTIVVTTLVTADMLIKCGVNSGFFSHIFIDEAAQAMELETLIPISIAAKQTKVVLAGDHLQLGPPVFSAIGRTLLLDKSLLVRLYESSPARSPRKLVLLENYRSYKEIVDVPSKLFYEGSLISKKPSPNGLPYPVQFYGVQGLEEKANDSLSYVNMAEVAEIAERVAEMVKSWPRKHWGEIDLQKTCVLCAHHAQIRQIRFELRLNGFHNVRVENVTNVQGLEFDVLLLSTVRTSRMLAPGQHKGKDLGLLSNPKLLNTAITRAKYSLIIVGDPKALCSVGDCRVCWKTVLSLCSEKGTYHYRVPLHEVLNSIRDDQTRAVHPAVAANQLYPRLLAPQVTNDFQRSPQYIPVNPSTPFTPLNIHGFHQVRSHDNVTLFPSYGQPVSSFTGCMPSPVGPHFLQDDDRYTHPVTSPSPTYTSSPNNVHDPTMSIPPAQDEKQSKLNQNSVIEETDFSSGADVIKTLRVNIHASLKIVIENEEAVETCIEQPLEDASLNIKENLERQLALIRSQKSQLEQQQLLHRDLETTVHQWQEMLKSKGHVEIDYKQSNVPSSTFVEKINLNDDDEICEWHNQRRQDPIVQDYIKSFEVLSSRAREVGIEFEEKPITESCQITRVEKNGLGDCLQGWVLQPDCVVYSSGCSFHDEHVSTIEAKRLIENGDLVACSLVVERSSGGNSAIGVIDDPSEGNIYIPDRKSMNRAFHTDYVAVQITEHDPQGRKQRHGKVVSILNERHHRQVVCRLSSSESNSMIPLNNTNPKFAILQSKDHIGNMGVAVFSADGPTIEFQDFISDVKDKLFLVQFLKWDANYQFPLGFVVKCFSECSIPTNALLVLYADYGIQEDFPAEVISQVNVFFPENWQIPEEERRSRRRYDDVFTIDVEGAEELDDAVSVLPVGYGVYCVTVHVADVSYFVSKDSCLDRTAQRRASSIYLPNAFNNSISLLPKRLSHDLCSLIPGKQRLAVSIEFMIDSSGKLVKPPVLHRTIVVSQERLSYDEVDMFLTPKGQITSNSKMTVPLLKSLQILHCLSQETWSSRVRRGSYQASTETIDKSPSRRIIEELMVLTNVAVADMLVKHSDTHAVPLRLQIFPKYRALEDLVTWANEEGLNIKETFTTEWLSEFQFNAVKMTNPATVSVNLDTWKCICQAIKINSMVDLTKAILSVHEDSPLKSVVSAIQRIMPKSKYVSSSQCSTTECRHFALSTNCYTHFTSPIRRYFDIIVHRVLLSKSVYGNDELETLCDNLNLTCERINAFSKQCSTVAKAELLHEVSPWRTMGVEIPSCSHLTIRNNEDDLIPQSIKLHAKDMGASAKEWNEDIHELLISWNFHDIDLQHGGDTTASGSSHKTGLPNAIPEQLSASVSKTIVEVPTDLWCQLLQASKEESWETLMTCKNNINDRAVMSLCSEHLFNEDDGLSVLVDQSGVSSVTRFFRRGDKLQGLFSRCSFNGLIQPHLQAIQVAPGKVCCVQHNQRPVENFTRPAKLRMRNKYSSIDQYLWIHIPLLMMESAIISVRTCVSPIQLRNAMMEWITDALNVKRGTLHIPTELLLPSMKIHKDDFICVRTATAVGHGQIEYVTTENKELVIKLVLISRSDALVSGGCTVEIIPQSRNYRRMVSCIRNMVNATEDVRSLILRRDWSTSGEPEWRKHPVASSFTLDSYQTKALDSSVNSPLTLIQGLPGTGKTYTAVAIAEHFFLDNFNEKSSTSNVLLCCPTDQAVDIAAAMLCHFSPNVPILRVYAREIEVQAFPELGISYGVLSSADSRVDPLTQKQALHFRIRSDSSPFKDRIEKYAEQINVLMKSGGNRKQFCKVLKKYRHTVNMAETYEISENESKVILCTCLEVASSRLYDCGNVKQCIIDESNMCFEAETLMVFQAIISSCNRVVLVGDCKELGPIIQNKTARRFGLGKSLFQSLLDHREKKRFSSHSLETQYRMHPSIGQLSASVFYNGQPFKNGNILTSRPDIGCFDMFWQNTECRAMVYHVCGEEKPIEELGEGCGQCSEVCNVFNEVEVKKVIEVVSELKGNGLGSVQISILTPYSAQETLIKTHLDKRDMNDVKVCSFIAAQEGRKWEHSMSVSFCNPDFSEFQYERTLKACKRFTHPGSFEPKKYDRKPWRNLTLRLSKFDEHRRRWSFDPTADEE